MMNLGGIKILHFYDSTINTIGNESDTFAN